MIVLSHRGYWRQVPEKNTLTAFTHSIACGFGTETDIRDSLGELVISHDMPRGGEMPVADFLALWQAHPELPLALNIKADGLAASLRTLLEAAGRDNYFVFDMSIPDMLGCLRQGLKVFARVSDVEPQPACFERVSGIWLDAFQGEWYDLDVIRRFVDQGKQVCVVSPDLHGRDPQALWERLAASDLRHCREVLVCTDRPEELQALLGGKA